MLAHRYRSSAVLTPLPFRDLSLWKVVSSPLCFSLCFVFALVTPLSREPCGFCIRAFILSQILFHVKERFIPETQTDMHHVAYLHIESVKNL